MKHVFQHNPCRVTELVSAINPTTCERTRERGGKRRAAGTHRCLTEGEQSHTKSRAKPEALG